MPASCTHSTLPPPTTTHTHTSRSAVLWLACAVLCLWLWPVLLRPGDGPTGASPADVAGWSAEQIVMMLDKLTEYR